MNACLSFDFFHFLVPLVSYQRRLNFIDADHEASIQRQLTKGCSCRS